jgi:hypothetical protein
MSQIRIPGNAKHAAPCADHGRHVIGSVILDLEQVRVLLQQGHTGRVAIQPFLCREDRRGDSMDNQEMDKLGVETPATGVKRERRHFLAPEPTQRNDLMHFDWT